MFVRRVASYLRMAARVGVQADRPSNPMVSAFSSQALSRVGDAGHASGEHMSLRLHHEISCSPLACNQSATFARVGSRGNH